MSRTHSQIIRAKDGNLFKTIKAEVPTSIGDVSIEIEDGFVTLRGAVSSASERERLHRFVMSLSGVRALKDLLQVQPRESVADEKIALHIRQALDAHAELPPGTAAVQVTNGECLLNGHVRSLEERHIAELVASHTRGVRKVINELTVDPIDEVSDEATVRAVQSALAYCVDFDLEGITVSCADGNVVLRGGVSTLMDRSLAEELARLQAGVRRVENHIQVTPRTGGTRTIAPSDAAVN
jgi:osmotically-inducible protein OsmY